MYFDLTGMLFDGRHIAPSCCGCHGRADYRLHGTKDLFGILASDGILLPAGPTRRARGRDGWYNTSCDDIGRALCYAAEHRIGSYTYRPVLEVDCQCFNSVPGAAWTYTKRQCRRYEIAGVYLVPTWYESVKNVEQF